MNHMKKHLMLLNLILLSVSSIQAMKTKKRKHLGPLLGTPAMKASKLNAFASVAAQQQSLNELGMFANIAAQQQLLSSKTKKVNHSPAFFQQQPLDEKAIRFNNTSIEVQNKFLTLGVFPNNRAQQKKPLNLRIKRLNAISTQLSKLITAQQKLYNGQSYCLLPTGQQLGVHPNLFKVSHFKNTCFNKDDSRCRCHNAACIQEYRSHVESVKGALTTWGTPCISISYWKCTCPNSMCDKKIRRRLLMPPPPPRPKLPA